MLAAKEDQLEIAKHIIIPAGPFMELKILKTPSNSIGIREYPTVLIILYKGMIYSWDIKLKSKKSKIFPSTNKAYISPNCNFPESKSKNPKHKAIKIGPDKSGSSITSSEGFDNFKIINILLFIISGSIPISKW